MQLNEILEEHTVKSISEKTNISEENIEALFNKEFDLLKRVKTLGFISIIEREYGADLSALKQDAIAYYDSHQEDESVVLDAPVIEKKKDKSKLFIVLIVILLGAASWYFITQFDQEKLRGMLPFNEEKMIPSVDDESAVKPELSIEEAVSEANDTESDSHSESNAEKVKEENGTEGSLYQSHTNL